MSQQPVALYSAISTEIPTGMSVLPDDGTIARFMFFTVTEVGMRNSRELAGQAPNEKPQKWDGLLVP